MQSYDERQAAAKLMTCIQCGAAFYVTQPRVVFLCVACEDKAAKAK